MVPRIERGLEKMVLNEVGPLAVIIILLLSKPHANQNVGPEVARHSALAGLCTPRRKRGIGRNGKWQSPAFDVSLLRAFSP